MDLVALLLIAALVTAIAGVLLAGFIFVPWLVALTLLLLLLILLKTPVPVHQQVFDSLVQDPNSKKSKLSQPAVNPKTAIAITLDKVAHNEALPTLEEPALIYRGTKYCHPSDPSGTCTTQEEVIETYMTYRGSRCKIYSLKVKSEAEDRA